MQSYSRWLIYFCESVKQPSPFGLFQTSNIRPVDLIHTMNNEMSRAIICCLNCLFNWTNVLRLK